MSNRTPSRGSVGGRQASYPLPAYLHFVPGGIQYSKSSESESQYYNLQTVADPSGLIGRAAQCDDEWRKKGAVAQFPSLSVLTEAIMHPLTGLPATQVRNWLDTILVHYAGLDDSTSAIIASLEQQLSNSQSQRAGSSSGGRLGNYRRSSSSGSVGGCASPSSSSPISSATDKSVSSTQLLHSLMLHFKNASAASGVDGPRPCGYVFRRGDIAWNCRTCQTDSTCVLCDKCFHASDHEGHEVFFHRTSPGGCCDCGDVEAWRAEGCCPSHRPRDASGDGVSAPLTMVGSGESEENGTAPANDFEAVRAAARAKEMTQESIATLPPALRSALGVVIGAAVQCVLKAVDGCGIGADISQWRYRWAEQIACLLNGVAHEEEYCLLDHSKKNLLAPQTVLERANRIRSGNGTIVNRGSLDDDEDVSRPEVRLSRSGDSSAGFLGPLHSHLNNTSQMTNRVPSEWDGTFPDKFKLHLRLHNDDVHTFDEVIEALYRQHSRGSAADPPPADSPEARLVENGDQAETMTHHVDTDGQVTVSSYDNFPTCVAGFTRLKQSGLLCSVVSTPQVDLELRARAILKWLGELVKLHPALSGIVVHALVDVTGGGDDLNGLCQVWPEARMLCPWEPRDRTLYTRETLRKRWLLSSQQARKPPSATYSNVPHHLPSSKLYKSPHALWGTLLSPNEYTSGDNQATNHYYIIDTDLRKQQETSTFTASLYPHRLAGLNLVSGISLLQEGYVNLDGTIVSGVETDPKSNLISSMLTLPYKELHPILSKSSFVAPVSPLLLMLLLDPYPTKQFRHVMHNLWLNLLVDGRFKSRFAACLGGVAYRSLTTLFCAGVGTELDSPLTFTVQIFTVKSLVNALNANSVTKLLLECDVPRPARGIPTVASGDTLGSPSTQFPAGPGGMIETRTLPLAICIVRVLHTNIVGSTKEVQMLIEHTGQGRTDTNSTPQHHGGVTSSNGYLPALVYQQNENPATELLPAAPDDGFLESRTTRHKRLPHLIRDLEYVFETQGTALSLLLRRYASFGASSISSSQVIDFSAAFARLLRLLQGMDIQKRKISGGHVEYEESRWLEAFALSLNFAGCRDALVESPTLLHSKDLVSVRVAMGNMFSALLREIKYYLYREELLDNGLLPANYQSRAGLANQESLQRSTLHVPNVRRSTIASDVGMGKDPALDCATGVRMSERELFMIESALRSEYSTTTVVESPSQASNRPALGVMMGDWLKVPHQPLSGDPLSFHLPLHRALGKSILSLCSIPVPQAERTKNPNAWWKLQILDGIGMEGNRLSMLVGGATPQCYLAELLLPTLRSSNCKIVWQLPDTSPEHIHMRRLRQYQISSDIAAIKVIHSLADLPIRCLAASAQIERHLWAKNGSSAAGMALNYTSVPLCKSFRDLDLALVQFSAAGFEIGLGARRVLALLLSRYSVDGYLKDPEIQPIDATTRRSASRWKQPPRLSDSDHAQILAESLFALLCVLVTELPPPPPLSSARDSSGTDGHVSLVMRRELLHALAAEPKSYSEAFSAALSGISRRDTSPVSSGGGGGGAGSDVSSSTSLRSIFSNVLRGIARERPNSNPSSGAPVFELTSSCSDEYDPTFYHLRRIEHQHAMDLVARLRHQKCKELAKSLLSSSGSAVRRSTPSRLKFNHVLPLVPPPPEAHPRFLPARLILHLPAMDAAIRRKLLFALFGGEWLPPPDPSPSLDDSIPSLSASGSVDAGADAGGTQDGAVWSESGAQTQEALYRMRSRGRIKETPSRKSLKSRPEFGPKTVQQSSVSSLEVLQLLTLQIHTLESMAMLHRSTLGESLDPEAKELSKSLNVNHYLARLIEVPESLHNVWAFDAKNGPLPSAGSGECRGSILGVLIALWEHSYSGLSPENRGEDDNADDDNGGDLSSSGGARALAADGLKWILRFVASLVDGATSVKDAARAATEGVEISQRKSPAFVSLKATPTSWMLSEDIQGIVQGMLRDVPKLWPDQQATSDNSLSPSPKKVSQSSQGDGKLNAASLIMSPPRSEDGTVAQSPDSGNNDQPSDDFKAKLAARKAAQKAALEKMRKQQAMFAASLGGSGDDETGKESSMDVSLAEEEEETDECIICRCGAQDSDSPLGFLGHVQRSRTLGLRCLAELHPRKTGKSQTNHEYFPPSPFQIGQSARVVGDRGCQLRSSPAMDSSPVACLPMGSVVLILNSEVSPKYDLRARRVFVRHIQKNEDSPDGMILEGWASIQSSQGYVILAPLTNLAFNRWGMTRPVLRLCGHAAHLGCVDAHCTSLRQRAEGDHPYDGRFAANIEDGEFLCPLCKQLSNVLLPQYHGFKRRVPQEIGGENEMEVMSVEDWISSLKSRMLNLGELTVARSSGKGELITRDRDAATRFSDQLYRSMQVPWDNNKGKNPWLDELLKWDYEEKRQTLTSNAEGDAVEMKLVVGSVLQHMREVHIAWALLGHATATAEASSRYTTQTPVSGMHQQNASLWPLDGGVNSSTDSQNLANKDGTLLVDPWTGYNKASRDNHAQVTDLKRLLHATCGVLDVVSVAIGKLDKSASAQNENFACGNGAATIGLLLSDILDGRNGGIATLLQQQKVETSGLENWKLVTAYLASIPMHVARDGLLSPRSQARANSAAMWVVRGCPIKGSNDDLTDASLLLESPPMPLAPQKVFERLTSKSRMQLLDRFGNLNTKDYLSNRQMAKPFDETPVEPYLPALASGFLYIPLLAWDLNTFAAAMFSSLLHNGQGTQCDDLARTAQALLIARLVQALITPNGFSREPIDRDFSMAENWRETLPTFTKEQREKEDQALLKLHELCQKHVFHQGLSKSNTLPSKVNGGQSIILDAVCAAVLPFARSVILLLRAGFSIVRTRQRSSKRSPSDLEEDVTGVLEHASTMTCADGLRLMRGLGCPLPSELITSAFGSAGWMHLIERWLSSVTSLETHHGSRGQSVYFDHVSRKTVPSYAINTLSILGAGSSCNDDKKLNRADTISSSGNEPVLTQTPKQKGTEDMIDEIEGDYIQGSLSESMDLNDPQHEEIDDQHHEGEQEMIDDQNMGRMGGGFAPSFAEMDEQDSDDDEEMIDDVAGGDDFFGMSRRAASPSSPDVKDDDETADKSHIKSDDLFADAANAPVIPYQPSLLAEDALGPGPRGASFDYSIASKFLYDMSHIALVHRESKSRNTNSILD